MGLGKREERERERESTNSYFLLSFLLSLVPSFSSLSFLLSSSLSLSFPFPFSSCFAIDDHSLVNNNNPPSVPPPSPLATQPSTTFIHSPSHLTLTSLHLSHIHLYLLPPTPQTFLLSLITRHTLLTHIYLHFTLIHSIMIKNIGKFKQVRSSFISTYLLSFPFYIFPPLHPLHLICKERPTQQGGRQARMT